MTPADTMRAAVEALEGDIMNLPRGVGWVPDAMTPNERAGYAAGHRDARHAAVELVSSALSLLRSALEGGEPEGWKLVPVEPTEAMCRAAADCQEHDPEDGAMSEAYYCYKAMLASIPPNTPVEAGKVGVAAGVRASSTPSADEPSQ